MTMTAMPATRLAARSFRLLSRVALGERGRLTLPRPTGIPQQLLQLHDPGVPLYDLGFEVGHTLKQATHQRFQLSDPVPCHTPGLHHYPPQVVDIARSARPTR
jgi:hypothetical protein